MLLFYRHWHSNNGDCVSVERLLRRRVGVEYLLPVHVDDVSVAMVTLQQHLEYRQVYAILKPVLMSDDMIRVH